MLWPASINSRAERLAVIRALKAMAQDGTGGTAGRRYIRFQARAYDKDGDPLGIPLEFAEDGGEITMAWSTGAVVWGGHFNFIDPHDRFPLDGAHVADGKTWWSKLIGVKWGIWVGELDKWVNFDVFRGYVVQVSKSEGEVQIDCAGKEIQHLDDYPQTRVLSIRKGAKVWKAIQHIFRERGETKFRLNRFSREIHKHHNVGLGAVPWKAAQRLVRKLDDAQLFYQGDGKLRLRRLPKAPSWSFTEGKDSLLLDQSKSFQPRVLQEVVLTGKHVWSDKVWDRTELTAKANNGATSLTVADKKHAAGALEVRLGKGVGKRTREVTSASGTTINLKTALNKAFEKGTHVKVYHRQDFKKPDVARAKLPAWHPFGAQALSDGKRPRAVVEDEGDIGKKANLEARARRRLRRSQSGAEVDRAISAFPIPGLEPLDVVRIGGTKVRVKSYTLPLSLDGTMELNFPAFRPPTKKALHQAKKQWRKNHGGKH